MMYTLLIIGAQFTVFSILLLTYDTYSRRKQEKERKQWQDRFFPSWSHTRMCIIYIASNILIWSLLYIYSTNKHEMNVSVLIISIVFFIILITDLLCTVSVGARFLMFKYGEQRNPVGYTLFVIATILFITNWIILIIYRNSNNTMTFTWNNNIFSSVMFGVYLLFSILLESIYFNAGFIFVFTNNSMIVSGIYGFMGGFVRPFFHFIYVMVKYIVVIFILIYGNYDNVSFYKYGVPFLMEVWLFALFFARRKNRPNPWKWLELNIWRPFMEFWWKIAVKRYIKRNPEDRAPKIRWQAIEENREKDESLSLQDQDEKAKHERKQSQLVRTISMHADI